MPVPRLIKWIVKDWWLKIIAVLAAVTLWVFARLEREYTRELRLGLDVSLLPPEYMVVEKNVDSVNVAIKGKGRYLLRLKSYEPKIVLPLSNLGEGKERLRIGPENVDMPEQIQIRSLDPYQIELTIKPRSKRKVQIIVPVEGIPSDKFAISSIKYENTVELYGPQEVVSTVNQLFSEPLNVEKSSESFYRKLAIQLPDNEGLVVVPSSVMVNVRVEPETTVVLAGLPVNLKGRPLQGKAYLLNKEVELVLSGPVSLLRGFSERDIQVSISVSTMTPGDYRLPAEVSVAPGIRVERSNPAVFRLLVR